MVEKGGDLRGSEITGLARGLSTNYRIRFSTEHRSYLSLDRSQETGGSRLCFSGCLKETGQTCHHDNHLQSEPLFQGLTDHKKHLGRLLGDSLQQCKDYMRSRFGDSP